MNEGDKFLRESRDVLPTTKEQALAMLLDKYYSQVDRNKAKGVVGRLIQSIDRKGVVTVKMSVPYQGIVVKEVEWADFVWAFERALSEKKIEVAKVQAQRDKGYHMSATQLALLETQDSLPSSSVSRVVAILQELTTGERASGMADTKNRDLSYYDDRKDDPLDPRNRRR